MSDKEEPKKNPSNEGFTVSGGKNVVKVEGNNNKTNIGDKSNIIISFTVFLIIGGAALAFVLGQNNGGQSSKSEQEKPTLKTTPTPSKSTAP